MVSTAPFLACLCGAVGLLALSASELSGIHVLPPWLAASVLKLHNFAHPQNIEDDSDETSGPEGVLIHQLKRVDPVREPKTAYSLHAAVGKILRASGKSAEALNHFEAARDAAVRATDSDALLAARLDVSEAYIEEGRFQDSHHELAVSAGISADHFSEHRSRLNRGIGRAKFELGFTESALRYFEVAEQSANQPEDKVRAACDTALARSCLGHSERTLEPLKQALDVLHAIRKAGPNGGMPDAVQSTLAAEVHFRLAESFHSMQKAKDTNLDFAKAHYTKALHLALRLDQTSPSLKAKLVAAVKEGIANLEHGSAPDLRCPRLSRLPWHQPEGPPPKISDPGFLAKVDRLQAQQKYGLVESELKKTLSAQSRPYKGLDAATTLIALGNLYRKQKNFSKAAKHFRQALHAAIVCCGANNNEAQTAYEGIRDVKIELPLDEQRVVTAAIDRYFDVIENGYPGERQVPEHDSPVVAVV